MATKYQPLIDFLAEISGSVVTLNIGRIEQMLGFVLPSSARHHRAWWSKLSGDTPRGRGHGLTVAGPLIASASQKRPSRSGVRLGKRRHG
jgi:hypothetical protein